MNRSMQLVFAGLLCCSLCVGAAEPGSVTLNLRDVEIQDAMAMLAKQRRLNILLSEGVEGSLSLNLFDVPVDDAVHAIANAAGYAVERRSGAYFVMEHANVGLYTNGDLTRVQRFNVHYADPADLEAMLEPYLSRYGTVDSIPARKLVLVSDKPEFLRRIAMIVRHADAKPRQVIIEAQILEISLNNEDTFGIDWTKFFDSQEGTGTFGTQAFSGVGTSGSNGFIFDYANANLAAILTALQREGRVRTLSTPKLIALDNQEAEVIIGDRRGYQVTTTVNQVTSETIEFLESGVILRVTPHIDESGRILMDVHPEVSTGTVDASGIPSQVTTEVTTSLLVPSGETVFIGGLIKHSASQSFKRIPLVGRLPLVKNLFTSRERTQVNTETIVLITPRIVEDLAADWNSTPRDKVDEAAATLESHSDELRKLLDEEPDEVSAAKKEQPETEIAERDAGQLIAPRATSSGAETRETRANQPDADITEVGYSPKDAEPSAHTPLPELASLSGDLYTVQLMTMSGKHRLDDYLDEHDISDLPIACLQHDGGRHYAVLLGFYPSFSEAQQAMRELPALFEKKNPWIRRLRSLQAMECQPIPEQSDSPEQLMASVTMAID